MASLMAENFSISKWSARNPLGNVALFISLIYGMSALLLGAAITSLTSVNQTVLVAFIVVFPFVVLAVFAWLVANHHRKLYGPGDYRSDEGFLTAGGPISPSEFRQRIGEAVEAADGQDGENQKSELLATKTSSNAVANESGTKAPRTDRSNLAARAYLAEGLVMQELQAEFGGTVLRELPLDLRGRRLILDGLINTGNEWIVVEIKFVRHASAFAKMLSRIGDQLGAYRAALKGKVVASVRFILGVVVDEPLEKDYANQLVERYRSEVGDDVTIRLYEFTYLAEKYGVAEDQL